MSGARAWGRCRQPKCGRNLTLRWVQQAQQGHPCVEPIKSLHIEAAVHLQHCCASPPPAAYLALLLAEPWHEQQFWDLLPAKGQKSCSSLTADPSGLNT